FPDYYMALGGLGRVRAAEGQLAAAVDLYRRAVARVPAPDLVAALGDVHDAAGHADEAERQYALVEYMGKVAAAVGTTYGRQLALFYADHDRRPEEALLLARLEAAARGARARPARCRRRASARQLHREPLRCASPRGPHALRQLRRRNGGDPRLTGVRRPRPQPNRRARPRRAGRVPRPRAGGAGARAR